MIRGSYDAIIGSLFWTMADKYARCRKIAHWGEVICLWCCSAASIISFYHQEYNILDSADSVNKAVTVVTLVFVRVSYFEVKVWGYQQTFGKYVESAAKYSTDDGGVPVDVDYEQTAVDQLWSKVKGIIYMVNWAMLPFSNLFGVE